MPSPFPGMDPYLEISGDWRDFHARVLNGCADTISYQLPENYIARIEEDFHIRRFPGETVSTVIEEVKERWIEIRRRADRAPVTIIELLSPSNKTAPDDESYRKKRCELFSQRIHVVELDLLIGGKRPLMEGRMPEGHYYVISSRDELRPMSEVWVWTIRDPLPTIPIALPSPDPDIALDLAAIFNSVYQHARYERSINYWAPLALPLKPEDRAWAEEIARGLNPRTAR